mgnify:CR=1 FL=1
MYFAGEITAQCAYVVHIDMELSAIHFEAIACMREG